MKWAIKILFRIFRQQFVDLVYAGIQPKKKLPQDKLVFSFFDLDGSAYYSVADSDMPVLRKLKIAMSYMKLVNGVNETDLHESIKAIATAFNEKDEKGYMVPNIGRIGWICVNLINRKNDTPILDYLYELAADYFIREDEDFALIDDEIRKDKVASIKQVPFEVIRDFFFSKSLNQIFPQYDTPDKFMEEILTESSVEALAYVKLLELWQTKSS